MKTVWEKSTQEYKSSRGPYTKNANLLFKNVKYFDQYYFSNR